jgi:acyl-CoA thioesterase I
MNKFLVKSGEKIVFIGDSITDCGRRDESAPFGNGYVKITIDLITAKYPKRKIHYYNKGISGNTILDLYNRWQDDVIALKPDWLTIKIGINDLHHVLEKRTNFAIPPDKFCKLYFDILTKAKKETSAKIVLIDPFYMSKDFKSNSFRQRVLKLIPEYLEVVKEMAKVFKTKHICLHEIFQEQLRHKEADYFCVEPVHPYQNGHTIIAYELLKKLKW